MACERELVRLAAEEGDRVALEEVFSIYEGLLYKLAHRYQSTLLPLPDAFQVAAVGLMKALRRYDPGRGVPFKSYAYPNIEGELKKFYRDNAEMIRLPRRIWDVRKKVRAAEERFFNQTGMSPKVSQIADILALPEDEILEADAADRFLAPVSIDGPAYSNADFQLKSTVGVRDRHIEGLGDFMALEEAIERLPANMRRVVELRLRNGWTQASVAKDMGISQMQVSRLQKKACDTIREYVLPRAN